MNWYKLGAFIVILLVTAGAHFIVYINAYFSCYQSDMLNLDCKIFSPLAYSAAYGIIPVGIIAALSLYFGSEKKSIQAIKIFGYAISFCILIFVLWFIVALIGSVFLGW